MPEIKIDIDITNKNVGRELKDAIEEGIKSASGARSANGLTDYMEKEAQAKLQREGAIWTGELHDSFGTRYLKKNGGLVVVLYNDADHAAPIEYGAEYGEKGPPVEALIPWVMTHLDSWSIPKDYEPSLPNPDDLAEDREDVDQGLLRLREAVDDGIVEKAFWLQDKIRRSGIDAVRFMREAEVWAEKNGSRLVAQHIKRKTDKI